MLVIGPNGGMTNGVQWYWVLKLTSAGDDPEAARRQGLVRLGDLLDNRTISYTDCRQYTYPHNLFSDRVEKDLGPFGLQAVLAIARVKPGPPLRDQ
jgi:hypothetical protein